ncbi:sterile alpha motif (SAM) domain-containing protein [Striga asiatica]|uniref:Sterile alpha motif (SAM) domain-containing protein n=1 Tax=Striga asiatica TaxID=4170 RepID=A0A5A7PKF3_STRAF|nr:sterile alpha motif (SAM) domain-containing protein [Striga asiatica]
MYADQVEARGNRSIKDRLNGNFASDSGRRRSISGKRQRVDDDKWEHDLYEDSAAQVSSNVNVSSRRVGVRDLRSKLQRKSIEQANKSVKGSVSGGARDLREKLSGIMNSHPAEPNRPTRKSVIAKVSVLEKKVAGSLSKKKGQQKVGTVDNILQSLGLEKYSITFQAEEVDMTALMHMTDEDLKALGIPMGPRKKILLAMESKSDV